MRRALPAALLLIGALAAAQPSLALALPDWADLRFDQPVTGARVLRLREFAQSHTGGWTRVRADSQGSYVRERWCNAVIQSDRCQLGKLGGLDRPGAAWFELSTFNVPKEPLSTYGLLWVAGAVPAGDGWACELTLALRGRAMTGSALSIGWTRFAGGRAVERLDAGERYEVAAGSGTIAVNAPAPAHADEAERAALRVERALSAMLASPDGLRAEIGGQLAALREAVGQAVAAGALTREERGPYLGDGLPPELTVVPLGPAEAAVAGALADEEIRRREAILAAHGPALHAALAALLPPDLLSP